MLEEERDSFLGRLKPERCRNGSGAYRNRNGYGKPRRFATTAGAITGCRPRVRNSEEVFGSKLLPLFKRRTKELSGPRAHFAYVLSR